MQQQTQERTSSVKRIKLLHLEDVATDAELVQRTLRRAGLIIEHRVVDTPEGLKKEVGEFQPDLILSDYAMPKLHGLDALALAHKLAPQTPFIFCSGSLGEEHAIRALQDGAADYVVKQNLLRLPAAVERAVEEARQRAERQRAEEVARKASEQLAAIFNAAPLAILGLDLEGRVVSWNAGAERLFGWTAAEATGQICPTVPEDGLDDFKAMIQSAVHSGPQSNLVRHRQKKGGELIQASLTASPLRGVAGDIDGVMVILEDVTERLAQRERVARLSRIREVLSGINAALLRVREPKPLFQEACRIAVETGGFQYAWVGTVDRANGDVYVVTYSGDVPDLLSSVRLSSREDDESGRNIVGSSIRTRQVAFWNDVSADPFVRFRAEFLQHGGRAKASFPLLSEGQVFGVLALSSTEKNFFDQDEVRLLNEVAGNIGFALDLIAKQDKVHYLGRYDVLTGLANRTLFQERLGQVIDAAHDERKLALVVVDLVRFKLINDSLGQQGGDELLRQVAGRLRAVVPEKNLARVGADRFAFMFPSVQSASDVMPLLTDAIKRVFEAPFVVEGRELRVTAKSGIALFPADGQDADTLFPNAEAALKQAKEAGDGYLFYAPQINAHVATQLDLENKLRKAVEQQQFVLHYQPKVDLQTRAIVGLEALIRWNEPGKGLVPPGLFIPMLEETGMILPVGLWAMEEAARTWRGWMAKGLAPPRIAVNVSAVQLRQPSWVADVGRSVALCGEGQCGLDLEITESMLMENVDSVIAKLKAVRDMDVAISIDDFGTGHSSLSYISRLPIDALKIDRSFIINVTDDPDKTSLVSVIIALAHSLRLKVIAEGVETEPQAHLLRLLRCDQMQGYLISKPVAAEQIEALLGVGVKWPSQ